MKVNWEKILLNSKATIREALKVIDEQASRIALIVDTDRKLLGTVTDGDIRRGLLNNITMDASVELVMNKNPITIPDRVSTESAKEIMTKKGILSLPVVKDGVVIGIKNLNDINKPEPVDNPVFLMAGGFGTRLRPLTNNCPKPLLKVGDKPILQITLENFVKSGFRNFYISTHFMPEMIEAHFGNGEKWGVNITYVYEDTPLGTGGALGLLPEDISKLPLIMINGDILTNIDYIKLLDFHNQYSADATMCVREYEYQIPYGVVSGDGYKVTGMEEKPTQIFYVNAGIYVLNSELVDSVNKGERIDMPTLLEKKMNMNGNVVMFPIHEYWLDIGRMDDFEKAQRDIKDLGFSYDRK